jgi:DNA repair exonuclease SbcCD ATPase subunit
MPEKLPPPPPPKRQKRKLSLNEFMQQVARSPLLREVPRADPKELRLSGGYRLIQRQDATCSTSVTELTERLQEIERQEHALLLREQELSDKDLQLQNRERDLWEAAALLTAKRKSFLSETQTTFNHKVAQRAQQSEYSEEEINAAKTGANDVLHQLQQELEAKQQELAEQARILDEREQFLEDSENTLMEKGMVLQEFETALQQKEEDLKKLAARLNGAAVPAEQQEKL